MLPHGRGNVHQLRHCCGQVIEFCINLREMLISLFGEAFQKFRVYGDFCFFRNLFRFFLNRNFFRLWQVGEYILFFPFLYRRGFLCKKKFHSIRYFSSEFVKECCFLKLFFYKLLFSFRECILLQGVAQKFLRYIRSLTCLNMLKESPNRLLLCDQGWRRSSGVLGKLGKHAAAPLDGEYSFRVKAVGLIMEPIQTILKIPSPSCY